MTEAEVKIDLLSDLLEQERAKPTPANPATRLLRIRTLEEIIEDYSNDLVPGSCNTCPRRCDCGGF